MPVCMHAWKMQDSETFVLHSADCSNAKEKVMGTNSTVPVKYPKKMACFSTKTYDKEASVKC